MPPRFVVYAIKPGSTGRVTRRPSPNFAAEIRHPRPAGIIASCTCGISVDPCYLW